MMTRPIALVISRARWLSGLRRSASSVKNIRWPPSRIGIGSRLTMPRFMLSIAISSRN